ncbi:hypothetical protein IX317_001519 [Fusobacterium sp. DD29]|uniref:autotransporter outer membrane beta-barrel domain-containing protein n=1 Tax=unclassified Fusobacterium TaxID=2648384 RepID=UPI001B8B835F|nr:MULTISPECIES: autotransporter domain-containing protein [unclassified Fusobacterium]MBR8701282.1 hypothetical protein [Fusobacterium sp. DD45]MBR8711045.1 hypothetical protein [Fusobacterium sp. DD28]MBR8749841.1 hypothetical protein [Fusobacterium sp. DD29]MBR8751624.1 hypothetical protein [Fusobacterium sp. DD26]MBR8762083.1 hypothetical protein [Fusobacterium sp. DD25]
MQEKAPKANGYESQTLNYYTKEQLESRNSQYFMVGGGRAIEFDSDAASLVVPDAKIQMAGPLVFGVAVQDSSDDKHIRNYATITDIDEKDELYIQKMPVYKDTRTGSNYLNNQYTVKDSSGNVTQKPMNVPILDADGNKVTRSDGTVKTRNVLLGPSFPGSLSFMHQNKLVPNAKLAEYEIRRSKDGYVGYKIGLAQIEEENTKGIKENDGIIDFRGEKSIGLYAYSSYLKRNGESYSIYTQSPTEHIVFPQITLSKYECPETELITMVKDRYKTIAEKYNQDNPGSTKPTEIVDTSFKDEDLKEHINKVRSTYINPPITATTVSLINGKGKYPNWGNNNVSSDYPEGKEYTGQIKMSGNNSYAMKWSMATSPNYNDNKVSFINSGEIELRKNPDGVDKADSSVGMGLLIDDSFVRPNVDFNVDDFYAQLPKIVDAYTKYSIEHNDSKKKAVELIVIEDIMKEARKYLENSLYVSLPKGKAVNDGSIKLKDNIANSVGMYVNIASDMTNKGTIEITADPEVFSNPETVPEAVIVKDNKVEYLMNIGMYAEQVPVSDAGILVKLKDQDPSTKVINDTDGYIHLLGKQSVGMISDGKVKEEFTSTHKEAVAQAINKGKIDNAGHGSDMKNRVFGMVAQREADILNEGTINIENVTGGAGMVIKKEHPTTPVSATGKNEGKITVTGIKSVGVFNEGTFEMSNPNAEVTAKGKGSMAVYARVTHANEPTLLKGGTITVADGAVALYPDNTSITLDNSSGNLKIIVGKNSLLTYNYGSGNRLPNYSSLELASDVDVNILEGGTAFYIEDTATGNQSTFIKKHIDWWVKTKTPNGPEKLHLKMDDGSILLLLNKSNIKLSQLTTVTDTFGDNIVVENGPNGTGDYKLFSVYRGTMIVDRAGDFDNPDDMLGKINMTAANVTVEAQDPDGNPVVVKGAKPGQIAFYQNNYEGGTIDKIKIINKGKIELTGNSVPADPTTGKPAKTTTALGGGYVTVNNIGDVVVSGDNALAMYGNSGTILSNSGNIELGSGSVGIYAINRDPSCEVGNENINITNTGTIKAIAGKTGTFGILAKNDSATYPSATSDIKNGPNSAIDLTEAPNSIGIFAEDTKVENRGTISVKKDSTAISIKDGELVDNGTINLTDSAIAYDIRKTPGTTSNHILNSTINLKGDNNTIFVFKNEAVDPISSNITINNDPSGTKRFNYIAMENAEINIAAPDWRAQNYSTPGMVLVNAHNSKVKVNNDITLDGDNSVAIYSIKDNPVATYDVDTEGTINLNGKNSIGIFTDKTGVYNKSAMNIGEGNTGIFVSESLDFKNDGAIKSGSNSTAVLTFNSDKFENNGDIIIGDGTGTISKAQGIVIKNTTGVLNNAKITTNGQGSGIVGIYAEGNGDVKNSGEVNITGNTPTDSKNIGVYIKEKGTKFTNDSKLITGENTVGFYGYDVDSTANSNIEIGKSGIGILTHDNTIANLAGTMKVAQGEENNETIALHHDGKDSDIKMNFSSIDLGKHSIGLSIAKKNGNNKVEIRTPNAKLNGESIYVYSIDETPIAGGIESWTNLKGRSTDNTTEISDGNYGYYVAGQFENHGNIDFSHELGSIGIYSTSNNPNMKPAINSGIINVSQSSTENLIYGIGMGAGHLEKDDYGNILSESSGNIINKGTINVDKEESIGMYAAGTGSKATNEGTINIRGKKAMGMYLGKGAVGINAAGANIEIFPGATGASAIYLDTGAILKNYGNITIHEDTGKGIYKVVGGKIEANTTNAPVYEHNAMSGNEKTVGSTVITVHNPGENKDTNIAVDGILVEPIYFDRVNMTPTSDYTIDEVIVKPEVVEGLMPDHKNEGAIFEKIGMYVDTSGIDFTHPINGTLKVNEADLIIGTEAAEATNETTIIVGDNIFNEYNAAIINNPQVEQWNVLSGSLTWAAAPNRFNGSQILQNVVMTKIKYTDTVAKDSQIYNFMDGMEQRYGMNALDSREKKMFNRINNIGKNEEILYKQAVNEMLGKQYVNTAKRVMLSHNSFYREFDDLMSWQTNTKDTMKVKFFGEHDKIGSRKGRGVGYKRDVQGVFVLNNNETVRLGESSGMFLGMANEQFKFRDIGKSKEKAITGQIGYYKSNAYGYNNEFNWTWKAGLEGSYRKMDRRYLVVDDIFKAKSKYHSYGVFLDNTLGVNYRLSEHFTIEPYAGVDLAGGRISKIHENSGEMRLDVKSKDYISVLPNAGVEVKYDTPLENKKLVASVDVNVSREFGNIDKAQMRARVNRTTADYYKLPKEKREKIDLGVVGRIGVENESYGVAVKVGYSTGDKALNGGLEFRMKF